MENFRNPIDWLKKSQSCGKLSEKRCHDFSVFRNESDADLKICKKIVAESGIFLFGNMFGIF